MTELTENSKKGIGVGNSDFRGLLEKSCYLVDKTRLIEDIIKDNSEVILFTKPRRFGKTLNMNMIEEFFNIEKDSVTLFKDTYINNKFTKKMNSYPCIFITFKDCKGDTKEELLSKIYKELKYLIRNVFKLDSNKIDNYTLEDLNSIYEILKGENYKSYTEISDILFILTKAYFEIYNQKVVLIFDEYDTPIQTSYDNNNYYELKSFFSSLYGIVLKDNKYLEKGILTGIQK